MLLNLKNRYLSACIIVCIGYTINAQNNHTASDTKELTTTILELDKKFWKEYNTCNAAGFEDFLTEDLEFYHDKGGLTNGRNNLITSVKNNLCNPNNPRVRREEVTGTVQVYPLNNYGAILVGEHKFFVTEKGKKEMLAEIAKFTHVWQYKNNEWRMSRVLSYDHQSAPQHTDKKEISLSDKILNGYTGTYQAPQTGTVIVSKKGAYLEINADKIQAFVYPQTESLFFHKQSPLTFEFIKDDKGMVSKMIVRENGKVVEEAIKVN